MPSQSLANALTKYTYDASYQLTRADYPAGAIFGGQVHQWTYDALGNRLTATAGASTSTYTYEKVPGNPNNWQRLLSDGVNSYTYDANGNTATKVGAGGSVSFTWDYDNRMTGISGAATASYFYDFRGRRTSKTVSGATTTFLYRGLDLIAEAGASSASYLFGPGIDEPLAMSRGGAVYYYDVDALGSVHAINDDRNRVKNTYAFDAWGVTKSQTGTLPNPFGYTAREFGVAGLWFYRTRWYDAQIGRFTQEDKLGEYLPLTGRDLYAYVLNSPASAVDPLGLQPFCRTSVVYGPKKPTDTAPVVKPLEDWKIEYKKTCYAGECTSAAAPESPVGMEACMWVRLIRITEFWRQRVCIVSVCFCPTNVSSSCWDRPGSDSRLAKQKAYTNSTFLLLYKPCPKPSF